MKTNFFRKFPNIPFDLQKEGSLTLLTDIFRYATLRDALVIDEDITSYLITRVEDGERPDILSYRLYGSVEYYWTFFILNPKLLASDVLKWKKSSSEMEKYINEKYGSFSVFDIFPRFGTGEVSVSQIEEVFRTVRVASNMISGLNFEHILGSECVSLGNNITGIVKIHSYDSKRSQLWTDRKVSLLSRFFSGSMPRNITIDFGQEITDSFYSSPFTYEKDDEVKFGRFYSKGDLIYIEGEEEPAGTISLRTGRVNIPNASDYITGNYIRFYAEPVSEILLRNDILTNHLFLIKDRDNDVFLRIKDIAEYLYETNEEAFWDVYSRMINRGFVTNILSDPIETLARSSFGVIEFLNSRRILEFDAENSYTDSSFAPYSFFDRSGREVLSYLNSESEFFKSYSQFEEEENEKLSNLKTVRPERIREFADTYFAVINDRV
jgi:hypothetical protein